MEHIGIHLMTLVKSPWGDCIRLDEMTDFALFHDFLDIFVGYDSTDKRYKLYIRLSNTDEEYNPKYSRKNCPKVCFFETTNNIVTTVAYIGDFLANGGQAEYGDYSFSLRDNIITQQAGNYISVTRKGIRVGIDPKERSIASFYYSKAHRSQLIEELGKITYTDIKEFIERTESAVNSYNLPEILSTLTINVEEFFIHKRGDDDTYIVEETRSVKYPIEELDNYLKEYLQLGRVQTYKDRGYCTAESMALKDLIVGNYNEEQVEAVRKELISKYSKEDHLQYLYKRSKYSSLLKSISYNYPAEPIFIHPQFKSFILRSVSRKDWNTYDEILDYLNEQIIPFCI